MRQALRQSDGKVVLLGSFRRVLDADTPTGLVRLLANGTQLDATFAANTASLQGQVVKVVEMPNGQLLLAADLGTDWLTLNGVRRQGMLRLLADGNPDPSFTATLGTATQIQKLLPQPDGKLLVGGMQFGSITTGMLRRLNTDGSPDTAFQAALGTEPDGEVSGLALQADGSLLVAGGFANIGGRTRRAVVRLDASGTLDGSFNAQVPANTYFSDVAVQPDGRVLLLVGSNSATSTTWRGIVRLQATGSPDASFQTGTNFNRNVFVFPGTPLLLLQPDGGIIVSTDATAYNGTATGNLVRLLPGGALDVSFNNAAALLGSQRPNALQLLPNGQLLAAGFPAHLGGEPYPLSGVARLNADGTRDLSFAPRPQEPGVLHDVLLQPDGKLLLAGNFNKINGMEASCLARLNSDGTVDLPYTAACGANEPVLSLALQPDGKVLAAGTFSYLGGSARRALARLTTSGVLDAAFVPALQPMPFGFAPTGRLVTLQPDGKVLLLGRFNFTTNPNRLQTMVRLETNGQPDPGFNAAFTADNTNALLLQPDGKILGTGLNGFGTSQTAWAWRLLADGTLDPAFTPLPAPIGSTGQGLALAQDATGRVYVGGSMAGAAFKLVRLLPDGTPDGSYQPALLGTTGQQIRSLALQPNGRLLLGGELASPSSNSLQGSLRLLTSGALDSSYEPLNGPAAGVSKLLIQPDGALVMGGSFTTTAGLPTMGLVRLLDSNVLSMSSRSAVPRTEAWPVPAHDVQHLALDRSSQPSSLELLDGVGRAVRQLSVNGPDVDLNTAGLAPGLYLLRVSYAAEMVVRRIVIE